MFPVSKAGVGGGRGGEGVLYRTSPGRPTDLAYSWAMPAILVAGKGLGGFFFFCFFTFIPVPLFPVVLFHLPISFLPLFGRRHKMTHKG